MIPLGILGSAVVDLVVGTYQQEVLANSPTWYFPLNDAALPIDDEMNYVTSVTVAGAYTLGAAGIGDRATAMDFAGNVASSGNPGRIKLGPNPHGFIAHTVEALVQFDTIVNDQFIVCQDNANTTRSYRLWLPSAGVFQFIVFTTGGGVHAVRSTAIVPGRRYHVAGSYDGSTVKIYLDGELQDSLAVAVTPQDLSTYTHTIGTQGEPTSFGFFGVDGRIAGVAFYQTALPAASISRHARAAGLPGPTPPPVLDNFNRADGAMGATSTGGKTWVAAGGAGWAVSSTAASWTGSADGSIAVDTGIGASYDINLTVLSVSGDYPLGIVLRGLTATSYTKVYRRQSTNQWIWAPEAGALIGAVTDATDVVNGDQLRVTVRWNDVKVYLNTVLVASFTIGAQVGGTFQGLVGSGGIPLVVDNFSVTETTQTAP